MILICSFLDSLHTNHIYVVYNKKVIYVISELFNQNGRIHTLEQAKEADKELKDILEKHNIEYTTVKTTEATDIITEHILDILNMK